MKVATLVILTVLVTVGAKDSSHYIYLNGIDPHTDKYQHIKNAKDMDKPLELPDGGELKELEVPPLALSCVCGEVKDGACSNKNKQIVHLDASKFKEGWPKDLKPIVKPTTKPIREPTRKPSRNRTRKPTSQPSSAKPILY